MGFLNFFKKKNETEVESSVIELRLSEIDENVRSFLAEKIEKSENKIISYKNSIVSDFRTLEKLGNELERKIFSESNERINAMINTIKSNYVKNIKNSVKNIKDLTKIDYGETANFCFYSKNALRNLKNVPPKHAYFLSNYFRTEMKNIIDKIKEIDNKIGELENYLKTEGRVLGVIQELDTKTKKISDMKEKNSELKNKIEEFNKKIDLFGKKLGEKNGELKELLGGKEYDDINNLKNDIERLENEKTIVENDIKIDLYTIKRPLEKFFHQKTDISSQEKKLIESFIHSPLKIFIEEEKFKRIIEELIKSIKEISLKDADKNKIEKLDFTKLFDYRERYKKIADLLEEKKSEFNSLFSKNLHKKKALEDEIKYLEKEIFEIKNDLLILENEMKKIESEISKEKYELEQFILKETGKNIFIKI